ITPWLSRLGDAGAPFSLSAREDGCRMAALGVPITELEDWLKGIAVAKTNAPAAAKIAPLLAIFLLFFNTI
ncbi:hypothetical protein J4212_04615, partial [Candidatus Woesearchaeota archaeon]|nr:hypothetical protein [Candidatus Woesearchaeota archaeon]